jgi:DUF438 domain-containing protein
MAQKPKPSKMAAELNAMAEQLAESQDLASKRPQRETDREVLAQIHNGEPLSDAPAETVAKLQAAKTADGDNDKHVPSISVQKPKAKRHQGPAAFGAATSGSNSGRIEIDGLHPARVLLPTGAMDLDELTNVLRLLPLDLTFVDATDTVRWFSDSGERVFPRTTAVIGRLVKDCHPPKSVDKVEKILQDFHEGKEDHADFWINLHQEKMIYIRYFAIRTPAGEYLGCLEVTQDISKIQSLEGEKRLGD